MKWIAILGECILLLVGCSTLPPTIRNSPPGNPKLAEVRRNITAYKGAQVRWGGIIMSVENEAEKTWIQVLHKRLNGHGRPRDVQESEGRFLMWTDGFLDPGIYAEGVEVTVFGELEGQAERIIGNHALTLPVIKAREHLLWKDYDRTRYYPSPAFYDYYPPYDYYDGYW